MIKTPVIKSNPAVGGPLGLDALRLAKMVTMDLDKIDFKNLMNIAIDEAKVSLCEGNSGFFLKINLASSGKILPPPSTTSEIQTQTILSQKCHPK